MAEPLLIAKHNTTECHLLPGLANRHGLITGATGTGKTVTLQTLAENFSRIGVPVFMADVKGDLTGASQPGKIGEKLAAVLKERGLDLPAPLACPTTLWDVFGEQGHPVRATVSDMGPLLLGRMLNLNETQLGVLNLVFKIADDNGMLLLDLKDLRAMLQYVGDNAKEFTTEYGNVSAASVGAIQRGLLQIEQQGGTQFFGEPMLDINDFMQTVDGHGVVNILAADKLMNSPRLYATFLLWMLSELFEQLPEIGDPEQPKLVFFFDEAHLLFNEAPKVLVERIELVVRLVRSKGVGVYFVTQNPLDIPDSVLAQLGNRVQHALRAFTPRDQKAVKATATTMRQKPGLDIETAITELAVGEALVSFLDAKGRPSVTERVFVLPPGSQLGPITPQQRQALMAGSLVAGVYEKVVDRESAYEKLKGRAADLSAQADTASGKPGAAGTAEQDGGGLLGGLNDVLFGSTGPRGGKRDGLAQTMAKSAVRTMGTTLGKEILRGVLGGIFGGGGRRR
ncbi:helicase HerA-like C-terminal domain-containing protein [Acidovorax sp. RAC01]|uniref:helicase HerA-like C-terminal domain-containing protein n=1 Tax=Acidovorax sp. RAC01 TaxID=1842533 RepID=UPI00083E7C62|nr:helicase HerA-like C-terminal domain-containing protein [Acidovorax sp. RAC01]AOG22594.1 ftsK/SpoIIIE family protein [Acidovorax sp. RAC01]